jgi:Putative auto-transporter adhesin, head GIN domain
MPAQVDANRPSRELRGRLAGSQFVSRELLVEELQGPLRIEVGPDGSAIRARGTAQIDDGAGRARLGVRPGGADAEAVVTVPTGAAITLRDVTGQVTIGDTDGLLTLMLGDGCEVRAGRVADADVRIDGDSRVAIGQVGGGTLDVEVTGGGRVQAGGEVQRLASAVHGAGDVQLRGCADEACLTVEGSGHIGVTRVRHGLASICVGSGGVAVSFPPSPVADRSAAIFDGLSAALAGR